jgi:hypothetical protein
MHVEADVPCFLRSRSFLESARALITGSIRVHVLHAGKQESVVGDAGNSRPETTLPPRSPAPAAMLAGLRRRRLMTVIATPYAVSSGVTSSDRWISGSWHLCHTVSNVSVAADRASSTSVTPGGSCSASEHSASDTRAPGVMGSSGSSPARAMAAARSGHGRSGSGPTG